MPSKKFAGLPTRKQILDFIASSDQPAGKREIARAFGLSGQTKIDLKRLLKDMADEGLIDSSPGRAFHQAGGVPKVTVLRVAAVDDGGTVWAVPEQWHAEGPAPRLRIVERGKRSALGIGDRKSTRLNSSHSSISYAVFCLKKKKKSTYTIPTSKGSGSVAAPNRLGIATSAAPTRSRISRRART